ncbi:MAG: hydrogenase nickel incorporation protein HypB [Planctomycetota bacterium]
MGADEAWARKIRHLLAESEVTLLNLIGAPGSGKTTLLEKTASRLGRRLRFAVLEGDVETTIDAERMRAVGVRVSQLLTGGACHLPARLVHRGLAGLPLTELDMVIVENVGNLICPAEFDIGEKAKVAVLSVAEGDEKPLKYPALFREASAVVLTKTDLLPYVQFDVAACLRHLRRIQPEISVFQVSAKDGAGLEDWVAWVSRQHPGKRPGQG